MDNIVIYTALFGDYDKLPKIKESLRLYRYVCFSDKEITNSRGWEVIVVESEIIDPIMNNRWYKFNPHLFFLEYEYSIYIDSNIKIVSDITNLISKYKCKYIAVPKHKYRNCLYEEFNENIKENKVNKNNADLQVSQYQSDGFPFNYGLGEMSVICRKHNDTLVIKAMELWWDEFNRGCKRDQLSFMYVCWKLKLPIIFMKENMQTINSYFYRIPHVGQDLSLYSKIRNVICNILGFIRCKYAKHN